jgi:hypothetical protein
MRLIRPKKHAPDLVFLVAGVAVCLFPFAFRAQSPAKPTFAFWYEDWQPDTTLKKMGVANVIIGVPPNALPEIHKAGKRGLQYVTYYQSVFGTAFLKDKDDLANVGFTVGKDFQKSAFGRKDNYVLCPNSVELKARVLRYLDASLKQGFDGYFVDNTFLDPPAHEACAATHSHIRPGAHGGRAYLDLLAMVRERMKQSNPGAILVTNPGAPAWGDRIADGQPTLWDVSDYVLWESYGYTSETGEKHDRWKQTIEQSFIYAAEPDKARKILVLSYPQNVAEARFAFAVARIFGFKSSANLGEKQQGKSEDGGHFGVFANEIPLDLGEPVGPLPDRTSPLLHRTFRNGDIYANTGTVLQHVSSPRNRTIFVIGSPHGKASSQLELMPLTAVIVLKNH